MIEKGRALAAAGTQAVLLALGIDRLMARYLMC
jgi:hypothetical protein